MRPVKFFSIALLLLAFPHLGFASFSDVPGNHAYSRAIEYVREQGIVEGYADGTFHAERKINRAEFIKIIMGATVPPEKLTGSDCFSDVKNEWFAPFVCAARGRGVISGYADGTFRPGQNITFIEAAKIIVNAFGYPAGTEAGVWYQPFVSFLSDKKAIPTTIAKLDKAITRGEMAEMVWRLKTGNQNEGAMVFQGAGLVRSIQGRGGPIPAILAAPQAAQTGQSPPAVVPVSAPPASQPENSPAEPIAEPKAAVIRSLAPNGVRDINGTGFKISWSAEHFGADEQIIIIFLPASGEAQFIGYALVSDHTADVLVPDVGQVCLASGGALSPGRVDYACAPVERRYKTFGFDANEHLSAPYYQSGLKISSSNYDGSLQNYVIRWKDQPLIRSKLSVQLDGCDVRFTAPGNWQVIYLFLSIVDCHVPDEFFTSKLTVSSDEGVYHYSGSMDLKIENRRAGRIFDHDYTGYNSSFALYYSGREGVLRAALGRDGNPSPRMGETIKFYAVDGDYSRYLGSAAFGQTDYFEFSIPDDYPSRTHFKLRASADESKLTDETEKNFFPDDYSKSLRLDTASSVFRMGANTIRLEYPGFSEAPYVSVSIKVNGHLVFGRSGVFGNAISFDLPATLSDGYAPQLGDELVIQARVGTLESSGMMYDIQRFNLSP